MDLIVNRFVTSHPSVHPLLIIGYEMFRIYAQAFNTIGSLELLVADEGHRLKNIAGTQTSLALSNCCALRRLVLTGTPIQNNLEELFAVIQFIIPGYLGTIKEFRQQFADPISKAKTPNATKEQKKKGSQAEDILRSILSSVILRRTQKMVLRHVLPPRQDYVLLCELTQDQKREYLQAVKQLLSNVNDQGKLCERKENKVGLGLVGGDGCGRDGGNGDGDGDADYLPQSKRARVSYEEGQEGSSATLGEDQEEEEFKGVLAQLTKLRLICGVRTGGTNNERGGGADRNQSTTKTSTISRGSAGSGHGGVSTTLGCLENQQLHIADSIASLAKLRVLREMILNIRKAGTEKIVIVSNFTSVLTSIQSMAKANKWGSLKLDGSVTPENRLKMVGHFNKEGGPFFLMLLSAKAGGVGLNLIGASRLIMFDCDWNPATDYQAMGRIWREGQTRPVFIYRLIAHGTIEQSIIARQSAKSLLSSVIREEEENPTAAAAAVNPTEYAEEEEDEEETIGTKIQNMNKSELTKLVLPEYNNSLLEEEDEQEEENELEIHATESGPSSTKYRRTVWETSLDLRNNTTASSSARGSAASSSSSSSSSDRVLEIFHSSSDSKVRVIKVDK